MTDDLPIGFVALVRVGREGQPDRPCVISMRTSVLVSVEDAGDHRIVVIREDLGDKLKYCVRDALESVLFYCERAPLLWADYADKRIAEGKGFVDVEEDPEPPGPALVFPE